MPIYAYKCGSCGFAKDVLQKISEPPLTICPACGEATFGKQVTAAGFQLKGSGWYATDFKGTPKAPDKTNGGAKADGAPQTGTDKGNGGGSQAAKPGATSSDGKPSADAPSKPSSAPSATPGSRD